MLLGRIVIDAGFKTLDIACENIGFEGVSGAAGRGGLERQQAGFGFDFAGNAESRKETVAELVDSNWDRTCLAVRSAGTNDAI